MITISITKELITFFAQNCILYIYLFAKQKNQLCTVFEILGNFVEKDK